MLESETVLLLPDWMESVSLLVSSGAGASLGGGVLHYVCPIHEWVILPSHNVVGLMGPWHAPWLNKGGGLQICWFYWVVGCHSVVQAWLVFL